MEHVVGSSLARDLPAAAGSVDVLPERTKREMRSIPSKPSMEVEVEEMDLVDGRSRHGRMRREVLVERRRTRALRSGDHEGRHQSRELGPCPDVRQRTAQSLLDGLWHAGDQPGWDVPPKRLREGSDALTRGGAAPRALPGHDTS